MSGEFQADAEDVLIPTSDSMVNEIANYRGLVDGLQSRVEEASTTAIVGDTGNALVAKVEEFHAKAVEFLTEIERTSAAVGDFGKLSIEQESENASATSAIDVTLA